MIIKFKFRKTREILVLYPIGDSIQIATANEPIGFLVSYNTFWRLTTNS